MTPFSSILKSTSFPWLININQSINPNSTFWPSLISLTIPLVNFSIPNFTMLGVISHAKLRSLNCSIKSNSQTMSVYICKYFLLKASATILALPGWQLKPKSQSFRYFKPSHLSHTKLLLIEQILQTLMYLTSEFPTVTWHRPWTELIYHH